ncbi:hypothetical protein DFP90_1242 [Aestuariispira insulae]|uniref:Uncharacterized protein n=1 Tax=Aestuariispira insulae TaxID=1461337 RepID=A0A3D9H1H6_9PROT|nr:hypothetical protein DFP90_1242 [Aestuariispira insulae]
MEIELLDIKCNCHAKEPHNAGKPNLSRSWCTGPFPGDDSFDLFRWLLFALFISMLFWIPLAVFLLL